MYSTRIRTYNIRIIKNLKRYRLFIFLFFFFFFFFRKRLKRIFSACGIFVCFVRYIIHKYKVSFVSGKVKHTWKSIFIFRPDARDSFFPLFFLSFFFSFLFFFSFFFKYVSGKKFV